VRARGARAELGERLRCSARGAYRLEGLEPLEPVEPEHAAARPGSVHGARLWRCGFSIGAATGQAHPLHEMALLDRLSTAGIDWVRTGPRRADECPEPVTGRGRAA
jgi:hypothetical protein